MKDPAILFYTADFITGTLTMTDEQRGKYIILLCLQHQKGYLTEKDMLNICKTYDEDIFSKFTVQDGKYYNERMKNEAEKRKKYSESRRNNRMNKDSDDNKENNICESYVNHMENRNRNIIIDINSNNINTEFENFRKLYPGTKRGYETEFNNFKKHKDWKLVVDQLYGKLQQQIEIRSKKKINGDFVPEWKNMQTWINQRCWEEEVMKPKVRLAT